MASQEVMLALIKHSAIFRTLFTKGSRKFFVTQTLGFFCLQNLDTNKEKHVPSIFVVV